MWLVVEDSTRRLASPLLSLSNYNSKLLHVLLLSFRLVSTP